jgi:hypothetical protein
MDELKTHEIKGAKVQFLKIDNDMLSEAYNQVVVYLGKKAKEIKGEDDDEKSLDTSVLEIITSDCYPFLKKLFFKHTMVVGVGMLDDKAKLNEAIETYKLGFPSAVFFSAFWYYLGESLTDLSEEGRSLMKGMKEDMKIQKVE